MSLCNKSTAAGATPLLRMLALGLKSGTAAIGPVDFVRKKDQRVLLPVSTNHTVCSMILKSSLSDMFSM